MKKIKISELPLYQSLKGLFVMGTDVNNRSVKVNLEFIESETTKAVKDADTATAAAAKAAGLADEATKTANAAARRADTAQAQAAQAAKAASDAAQSALSAKTQADAAAKAAVPQISEEERRAVAEAQRAERIEALKERLAESDYKAIKYAEGWLTEDEYAATRAQRQALRDKINELEAELAGDDNDNNV